MIKLSVANNIAGFSKYSCGNCGNEVMYVEDMYMPMECNECREVLTPRPDVLAGNTTLRVCHYKSKKILK